MKLGKYLLLALLSAWAATACSAGNGGSPDRDENAAVTRALENAELLRALEALDHAGWSVVSREEARVEWLEIGAEQADGATRSLEGSTTTWTRVHFAVQSRSNEAGGPWGGELVVAWADGEQDVLALNPNSEQAVEPLLDALSEFEPDIEEEATDDRAESPGENIETTSEALTCKGIDAGCSASSPCCRGLGCVAYSYYSRCACNMPVTVSYPERATVSVACFAPWDNPIGAAKIQRYYRGCVANNGWDLTANACGKAVSIPAYRQSTWTQLVCLFTPGPIC